jgi:hypothetical protein
LHTGDWLKLFPILEDGTTDVIFADPSFKIGYDYRVYDDRRDAEVHSGGSSS